MAAFLNFDPHKLGGARNNEAILAGWSYYVDTEWNKTELTVLAKWHTVIRLKS